MSNKKSKTTTSDTSQPKINIRDLVTTEIIEMSKNKKNNINNSIEKCVSCGEDTIWRRSIPIYIRENYVEGMGQFCDICFPKESSINEIMMMSHMI